ncbi:hypothetical protein D4R87_02220 [bacterium]|nr:MAG: hypothetical protein D4R87_02220 [bacterium]
MLKFLNNNQGLIAAIAVIVGIVIAIIGFFVNKNVAKINQNQKSGDNSNNNQSGGDININK